MSQNQENIFTAFGSFEKQFKVYEADTAYSSLREAPVSFNGEKLELVNIDDTDAIVRELNQISRLLFTYGCIMESQARVVQAAEEELDIWLADKRLDLHGKDFKSEKAKDDYVKVTNKDEYLKKSQSIRDERYKEGLLSRTVKGLDSFSYKLHSILSYKEKVVAKF